MRGFDEQHYYSNVFATSRKCAVARYFEAKSLYAIPTITLFLRKAFTLPTINSES